MEYKHCIFDDCNRGENHAGPHGMEVEPGVIVGAFGGDEGKLLSGWYDYKFPCNDCGKKMRARNFERAGQLKCTACPQVHFFTKDYHTSSIATAFPANMHPGSAIYRKYRTHRAKVSEFKIRAMLHFGLVSYSAGRAKLIALEMERAKNLTFVDRAISWFAKSMKKHGRN